MLGQQNGSAVRGLRVAAVLDLCGRSIERRLSCARLQTIDTRNARTRGGRLSAVLYSDLRAQSLRCTGPLDCGFCARHQDLRVGAASPSLSAPRMGSGRERQHAAQRRGTQPMLQVRGQGRAPANVMESRSRLKPVNECCSTPGSPRGTFTNHSLQLCI